MKSVHNIQLLMVMSLVFCGQTMFGMDANTAEQKLWNGLRLGNLELVQAAIAEGANVNWRDNNGYTALTTAVFYNRLEMVQVLIAAEADVNIRSNNGQTALKEAVLRGNLDMVHLIINADGFDADQLQPIIDDLATKENKTGEEQEILEVLEQRQTFNSVGLK